MGGSEEKDRRAGIGVSTDNIQGIEFEIATEVNFLVSALIFFFFSSLLTTVCLFVSRSVRLSRDIFKRVIVFFSLLFFSVLLLLYIFFIF